VVPKAIREGKSVKLAARMGVATAGCLAAFLFMIAIDRVAALALEGREALIFAPNSRFRLKTTEFDFEARINAFGFRDRPFRLTQPGLTRVLAIGDSFTYGWGVQDSEPWPKVLERDLSRLGMPIEIANLGRPGAGPEQYLEIARAAVPLLKPRWIIVGLLQGDDLSQSKPGRAERTAKATPVLTALYPTLSQIPAVLTAKPPIVTAEESRRKWREQARALLVRLKPRERQRFDSLDPPMRERFLAGDMNPDIVAIALHRPDYSSWLLDESSAEVQSKVTSMADRLARIRELAQAYGARVIVVSIPNWPYVSHSASLRRIGFVLNDNMLSTDAPDDEARQACREAGIDRFLSVTDEIRRRAAEGAGLYYALDGHFTREGHKAFADALAPQLWRILSDQRT
jgi:lysophospholipase L1-like esterase